MRNTDPHRLYEKIFRILGDLTPLRADCGLLCEGACCKGDATTGMRLFPQEETDLPIMTGPSGVRLAVCSGSNDHARGSNDYARGTCDRTRRPLSCRIFPFFPTIDERGKIFVEPDYRGKRLCPLLTHSDELVFDPRFFRALKRVGKLLAKDPACREFLVQTTEEIDLYRAFLAKED